MTAMRTSIARALLLVALVAAALGIASGLGRPTVKHGSADVLAPLGVQAASAATPSTPAATPKPTPYINDQNPSPTPVATASAAPAPPRLVTIQLGPYNDASVVSGGMWPADQNLGGWPELAVGPHSGGVFRSYLRFLLAGLPQGIQIDSARLLLTPTASGSRAVSIAADVIQDDWNEQSITWNQQPLTTWRAGDAMWQPGTSGVTIDLTAAARNWYACGGTSNNGVALSADLSPDWVGFGSRKSDAPPVLELVYEASSVPVNCSASPATGVNLAVPSVPGPATSGAQFGSVDPNTITNPLIATQGFCSVLTPVCPPGTSNTLQNQSGATRSTAPAANLGGSNSNAAGGQGAPTTAGNGSQGNGGSGNGFAPTPTPSPSPNQ